MTPFEFGQLVGNEKRAEGVPPGHGVERALHFASKAPTQAMGGALGGLAGAAVGVGNMGFRGASSVARGMDSGINAGTQAMDKMMGGPATGIGGKMLRAPAQALGAGVGAIGGAVRAPFSALGGVAHDTYQGARKGVNIAGRLSDASLPAPSYAGQQQPGKVAMTLAEAGVIPLTGAAAGGLHGVINAPKGQRLQGAGRGALTGAATGAGALVGGLAAGRYGIGPTLLGMGVGGQVAHELAKKRPPVKAAFAAPPMSPPANANTLVGAQKPQVPFGTGQQNQKINLGGGKDMLSQGMSALQGGIDNMKKRFPQGNQGNQI
jgi:hypothetical protein